VVKKKRSTDLFNKIDGRLQVEAEIDELPLDALSLVLFLLEDEHGVVEELLELLVRVVDAQLLEGVQLIEKTITTFHFRELQ
jgi:hypothetical protein